MTTLNTSGNLLFPAVSADSFAPWSRLSKITGHLNRAFAYVGRDAGPKSVSLDLSRDDGNLIFGLDGGSVGHALLDATLINSACRVTASGEKGLTKNRYRLSDLSAPRAHLDAYRGPRHYFSWRVDLLI